MQDGHVPVEKGGGIVELFTEIVCCAKKKILRIPSIFQTFFFFAAPHLNSAKAASETNSSAGERERRESN